MNNKYRFGDRLTTENFEALRKLAQKLSYKDFSETTGFGHGIYTRLRRFEKLGQYKEYIAQNQKKSYKNTEKKITLADVYKKLEQLETSLNKRKGGE